MAILMNGGSVSSTDLKSVPGACTPRSSSSLIFLMTNEFRANRNPLKKPLKGVKSLSHGRPVRGRPRMRVPTTFLPTTAGSRTGGVGGEAAAWVLETGPEGPHKLVKPRV